MVILCWAAKGGSGTTVVTAALALNSPRRCLLVDLDGELPAALGIPDPDRPGVADWLSSDAPPAHLDDLTIDVTAGVTLLPHRQHSLARHPVPLAPMLEPNDGRCSPSGCASARSPASTW